MFQLNKESRNTFLGLLIVPFVWIGLNSSGILDGWETWTLDKRMTWNPFDLFRGEISHRTAVNANEKVTVENNQTIPRIPKVMYVNFDARTMGMEGVGERPWDRAFFRDVARVLLKRGKARVVAFDFGFTPKSVSQMVPEENVYRSDSAIGELVADYPERVVLGALYSGVPTQFVKETGANAYPPFFKDGFVESADVSTGKHHYPEAPTYPLQSYGNGNYVGRIGSFTVPPYRSVDEVPRWVPLWFPGGGKAHAYNVLGGKRVKLALDLRKEITTESERLKSQIAKLDATIGTLQKTLEANPAIAAVVGQQLKARESEREALAVKLSESEQELETRKTGRAKLAAKLVELERDLEDSLKPIESVVDSAEIEKLEIQIDDLDETIGTFRKTLEANPAIAAVVELQLKNREEERKELAEKLSGLKAKQRRLARLSGNASTELVEVGDRLRLVYKPKGGEGNGTLVDSLPNEMPLYRGWRCYALGLEALLAYYGVGDEAVTISEDKTNLRIVSRDGKVELVNAPMSDGQFTEVNWFSKWSERIPEIEDLREAKKLYAEEKHEEYVALAPGIIRGTLDRVKDIEVPKEDADLLKALADLGVEQQHVTVVEKLLKAAAGELDADKAPAYNDLENLYSAIRYYFLPVGLESSYNPMCGMRDVLDYNRFHGLASENIKAIESKIAELKGPNYLEKLEKELEKYPDDKKLQSQKAQVLAFIQANQREAKSWKGQLSLINAFFAKFDNSIVFIGPEEATFQDLAPTPFDSFSVPKVSTHGNLVKTLTSGFYLKRLPEWMDLLITLGFCVLMAFLAVYQGPKSSWVQAGGVAVQIGYLLIAFTVFSETHVIWPVATPTCAGLSTTFVGLGVMLIIEQKAKGRLKGMFGSYVSSDLVDQMLDSGEEPSLGGEETQITAYFSDVQSFSSFSELLSPTQLVDLMNEYLTAMTNIIQEERGTLDKYIGDAIVAMYGAPIPMEDHAYQSVKTTLLMQACQVELREKWASEGDKWPDIVSKMQTRIGCNTGTCTVGNMGALDRFQYTMMGDMVNLAARCESGAKSYGAYIMITEETKDAALVTKDDIAYRYLDKIIVKGRTQPVAMYEVTGFAADLAQETQDCLDCFQQGIDKYLLQDWDGAKEMFEKSKELEPYKAGITPGVKDNPSTIFAERCLAMKWQPPGDDWDGVFVMTSK